MRILRGFMKNKEFGLGSRQALRLQEQVVHVAIATAAPEQGFDVAVDRFDHSQRYFHHLRNQPRRVRYPWLPQPRSPRHLLPPDYRRQTTEAPPLCLD